MTKKSADNEELRATSQTAKPATPRSLPGEVVRNLPAWREEHGELLFIEIGRGFVLRPMTRGEVLEFEANSSSDPIWAQIHALKSCLIWPYDWDGAADSLSLKDFHSLFGSLWDASGFRRPDTFEADLNRMRLTCMEWDHAIIRHICMAFNGRFAPDDLNGLSRSKILYLLAQAECMIGLTYRHEELDKVQKRLISEAEKEAKADKDMSEMPDSIKRTFSVERDAREMNRFDNSNDDIDMPLDTWRGRVPRT